MTIDTIDWIKADYHRLFGTEDGIRIAIDGRTYRLVTWYGAGHFRDRFGQVWMHRDDFARQEWVEIT